MNSDRLVPKDPKSFIQRCVGEGKMLWTYHVNMRLRGRSISRREIIESVESYEIIEAYPDDKYLPSYLVYSRYGEEVIHVLFATDVEGDNVRAVTAYHPDPEKWEPGLKTRRRNQ